MNIIKMLKLKCFFRPNKEESITRALKCKGWTSKEKLSLLYEQVRYAEKIRGDILEIGSAWGRSTVLLALSTTKLIWSIDPHTGGIAFIRKGETQNSYDEFIHNLKENKIEDRVNVICNTTSEVQINGIMPLDVVFSLVFIDGLHTAEGVKVDFNFAYNRLVESGVIIFDDYFEETVSDYSMMIDELIIEKGLSLVKDENSRLVYIIKPS